MIRVLLIGGGHSHVVALRALARSRPEGIDLHLASPDQTSPYSGLLPGHVAGHWTRPTLEIPLPPLCHTAGATLHVTRVTALDPVARHVTLADGRQLAFDYASLDIGAIAAVAAPESLAVHGTPVKPLGPFADRWDSFAEAARTGQAPPHAAVIGAGTAGIELALSMLYRLQQMTGPATAKVALIEQAADILPGGRPGLRARLRSALRQAGIDVHTSATVEQATSDQLRLSSGPVIPAGFIAVATGARPHPWLADTGLALHDGFVAVDETLRSTSHPHIFACGDTAHLTFAPRPKAGVFAVRQGPVLARQVHQLATGAPLATYMPQGDYLKLISLGRKRAIAEKWGIAVNLPGLWTLKRHIDMKFMKAG